MLTLLISEDEDTAVSPLGDLPFKSQVEIVIRLARQDIATAFAHEFHGTVLDDPLVTQVILLEVAPLAYVLAVKQ